MELCMVRLNIGVFLKGAKWGKAGNSVFNNLSSQNSDLRLHQKYASPLSTIAVLIFNHKTPQP